jgi:hypothetical protein
MSENLFSGGEVPFSNVFQWDIVAHEKKILSCPRHDTKFARSLICAVLTALFVASCIGLPSCNASLMKSLVEFRLAGLQHSEKHPIEIIVPFLPGWNDVNSIIASNNNLEEVGGGGFCAVFSPWLPR